MNTVIFYNYIFEGRKVNIIYLPIKIQFHVRKKTG